MEEIQRMLFFTMEQQEVTSGLNNTTDGEQNNQGLEEEICGKEEERSNNFQVQELTGTIEKMSKDNGGHLPRKEVQWFFL